MLTWTIRRSERFALMRGGAGYGMRDAGFGVRDARFGMRDSNDRDGRRQAVAAVAFKRHRTRRSTAWVKRCRRQRKNKAERIQRSNRLVQVGMVRWDVGWEFGPSPRTGGENSLSHNDVTQTACQLRVIWITTRPSRRKWLFEKGLGLSGVWAGRPGIARLRPGTR